MMGFFSPKVKVQDGYSDSVHARPVLQRQRKYDMLRGVAAIAVLFAHVVQTLLQRLLGSDHTVVMISGNVGRHAVLVFFLLSGYLITQSIIANVSRNGSFDTSAFLSARVARIYPPLTGAILVVLLSWVIIHALDLPGSHRYGFLTDAYAVRKAFIVGIKDIPYAFLMQNGMLEADGPLWSLYIEFHLYLIAMFIAMAKNGRKRLLWIGCGLMLFVYCYLRVNSSFAFFAAVWALGAGAVLVRNKMIESGAVSRMRFASFACTATLLGIALIEPHLLDVAKNSWIAYGVQLTCCLVYVDRIFFKDDFAANPPNFLVQTGNFSYSLYVIHFPLLLLILSCTQNYMGTSLTRSLMVSTVAIVAVLIAAAWFAKFFENPRHFKPYITTALKIILPAARN